MRLPITEEMKTCREKYKPYLNGRFELRDDAPEEAKEALEEFRRLAREQEEFELSLW